MRRPVAYGAPPRDGDRRTQLFRRGGQNRCPAGLSPRTIPPPPPAGPAPRTDLAQIFSALPQLNGSDRTMADPMSVIPAILAEDEAALLEEWIGEQAAGVPTRRDLL